MKNLTRILIVLIILSLVAGCGGSDATTTPEPTDTPQPTDTPAPTATPTPTPIPLSELELEPLLIQAGDLPAGFSGAQVRDVAPQMFDELPIAENVIDQRFEKGGAAAGGVTVILYSSKSEIDEVYGLLVSSMGDSTQTVTEVGEQAIAIVESLSAAGVTFKFSDLTFIRCSAVVYIRMSDIADSDAITAYAKRLDSRLEPVVCRPNIPETTSVQRPTKTPKPTNTPSPTATPTPIPEPISLAGSGDSVVDFDLQGKPAIVHITGNATGHHFAVESYDNTGERLDLLVNTTDPYDGFRPIDWLDDEYTTRFQVTANGAWTIDIVPLAPIPETQRHILSIPGTYEGTDDDVIILAEGTPDLATIEGNAGGHHFAVTGWSNRRELLVNTVDPYEGTVILSSDTFALEIVAQGDWSVTVASK